MPKSKPAPADETIETPEVTADASDVNLDRLSVIKDLPVSSLRIDNEIQRPLLKAHANALYREFNLDALGSFAVSRREDGTYVILDGRHRWTALAMWMTDQEIEDMEVRCEVWEGLSRQDEARIFRERNHTQKVSALHRFLVSLTEQDPESLAISELLARHGWRVAETKVDGSVSSVTALLKWYRRNPWALDRAFYVLTKVWGTNPRAADYRIFGGLAMMFDYYKHTNGSETWPGFKVDDLINNLGKLTTLDNLIGQSTVLKSTLRMPPETAMAFKMVETYNHHKSTTALRNINFDR